MGYVVNARVRSADGVVDEENLNYARAIRLHCMDCCNWQYSVVEACPCDTCALWSFRFGGKTAGFMRGVKYITKSEAKDNPKKGKAKTKPVS